MANKHSFLGMVDRFGGGIPEPVCSCDGPWNLYDGVCLVQDRERRTAVVEQFTAALLTGLDDLERDDHHGTLVRPGDVADLVHRVAAEVGRS